MRPVVTWSDALRLSCLVACVSFIVSESVLFAPVRRWMASKSEFFGHLIGCTFCFSVWVSLTVCLIRAPLHSPFDFVVTVFQLVWMAGLQWAVFCALLKYGGK